MSLDEAKDVLTGLVSAGRWPDYPTWADARFPDTSAPDPLSVLDKLF